MTRYQAKHYAQALFDLTVGKSESERAKVFELLLVLLKKNKQLNLVTSILECYQSLLNQQTKTVQAVVYYDTTQPNEANLAQIKQFLLTKLKDIKNVELSLIKADFGEGLKVETSATLYDLSLMNQIDKFKQQLLIN